VYCLNGNIFSSLLYNYKIAKVYLTDGFLGHVNRIVISLTHASFYPKYYEKFVPNYYAFVMEKNKNFPAVGEIVLC
jgi:hypothetical protein